MNLLSNITVNTHLKYKLIPKIKPPKRWLYPTLGEGSPNCLSHQLTTGFLDYLVSQQYI